MRSRSPLTGLMARHPRSAELVTIALFLLVWEIAARFFVDKMFLAPPSRVYGEIGRVIGTKGLPQALGVTLYDVSFAFVVAVAIGMTLGLSVGLLLLLLGLLSLGSLLLLLLGSSCRLRATTGLEGHNGSTRSSHLFLCQHDSADHGLECRLVDARGEPAHNIGERGTVRLIRHKFKGVNQSGHHSNVGESNLVTYQIRLFRQVLLQHSQCTCQIFLSLARGRGIERHETQHRIEPYCSR